MIVADKATLKKALLWGAFLFVALPVFAAQAGDDDCLPERFDETVTVVKIIDGDTVRLADGRKLRLIGLNAPERARDGRPAEPFAEQATVALQQVQMHKPQWQVRWGRQLRDRYGRWLGHPFAEGNNITAGLIGKGLATSLTVPPNVWGLSCYQQHEQSARRQRLGLWSDNGLRLWRAEQLPQHLSGYQLIQGRVTSFKQTRKSLWLNIGERFSVRIARQDIDNFLGREIEAWVGRRVEVRGWVNYHKGRLKMRIRHPASIKVIN